LEVGKSGFTETETIKQFEAMKTALREFVFSDGSLIGQCSIREWEEMLGDNKHIEKTTEKL